MNEKERAYMNYRGDKATCQKLKNQFANAKSIYEFKKKFSLLENILKACCP